MPAGAAPGERRGGRKKGSPNKRTADIAKRIEELGCDPIEGMIRVAKKAEDGVVVGVDDDGKPITKPDLTVAGQMYKELSQYIAPKLKSIEHTGAGGEALKPQPLVVKIEGI